MNKRLLTVFVLGSVLFSAQAQQSRGGISDEMLREIKQSYQATAADRAIRNAIGGSDIRTLALNQENPLSDGYLFSKQKPIRLLAWDPMFAAEE